MSDWVTLPLSDLAEIRVSNVDKKSRLGEKPAQICNYMDVYSNEYINGNIEFMQSTANSVERERFKVCSGDVIITKDSETPFDIGIPAVVMDDINELVCGYHLALIKPNKDKVNSVYLSKQLASNSVATYFSRMAAGSTRYGLSNGAIAAATIPLAPKEQQRKIAAILITIDQTIEKTEAFIHKYQQIKAGLMHDLFTRGLTADGKLRPPKEQAPELYQETPIGWIPKEWKVLGIEEIANVVDPNPSHRNPIYHDDGYAFISTVEFVESDKIETDTPRRVIEEIVAEQEKRCGFSPTSIAFSRKGTIAEIRFLPTEVRFALLDSLCVINPDSVVPSYLFHSLRSEYLKSQIRSLTMGQALPQMSIGRVRGLKIPYPMNEFEQYEIGARLDSITEYINCNTQDMKKLRKLKSGLMHDLLTGKDPVTIDQAEAAHV